VVETQEVDVQQVMERIREAIRRRRSLADTPAPSTSDNGAGSPDFGHLPSLGDLGTVSVTSHRRLVGPLIVAVKRLLLKLLTPLLEQQAAYNAAVIRAIADTDNRMQALGWHTQALARGQAQLEADVSDLRRVLDDVARVRDDLAHVTDDLARVRGDVLARIVEDVGARHAALRQEILELRGQLADQGEAAQRADVRLGTSERKWRRLLHLLETGTAPHGRSNAPKLPEWPPLSPAELEPEFDYAGFEERFRGSEAKIKEGQRIYLPYFEGAPGVVDLGCGRGEFLELLRERGIKAQGVDLDLDVVLLCREKGLDVVREDAFAYLAARPDDSIGGIFSAQFIEHLPPRRIIELVKLCHRKLAPGGCLALETPNPACLLVLAYTFYRDLTHVQPIHSDTMKFLLETAGFHGVEVKGLSQIDLSMRIPPLPSSDPAAVAFNQGIERVNTLLFGFQDYAVIGRKGGASASQTAPAPGPDA
jgi:O-antigen chain-terminating methyltransferase